MIALVACSTQSRSLQRPNAVCLDEAGGVFVSDYHNHRLVSFDAGGGYVGSLGSLGLGRGEFFSVNALWCGAAGEVYALDRRPHTIGDTERLWEMKRVVDRAEVGAWTVADAQGQEIAWVGGIARLPDGDWVLSDTEAERVVRVDPEWDRMQRWAQPGPPLASVEDIDVAGGEVWLTLQYAHQIRRFDAAGHELATFGGYGRGAGQLVFPIAAAVCPDRWVAVADLGNHRVQRYDLQGAYLDGFAPARADPDTPVQVLDIAVDAACEHLYVVDSSGNRVLVTTPTGEVVRTFR